MISHEILKIMQPRTETIHQAIDTIIQRDDSDGAVELLITQHLDTLCSAFPIQHETAIDNLRLFVYRYIKSAPDYLDIFCELAVDARLEPYTHALLARAESYFFEPQATITQEQPQIQQLLAKAYLCHRLLEELNDQITTLRQVALAPIDIAEANIISHTILGDELANKLDQSVLIHLELAALDPSIFNDNAVKELALMQQQQGWDPIKQRWPCLNEEVMKLLSLDDLLGPRF